MNKIELVITQKEAELTLLQKELEASLEARGDTDYEFAALLYPVIEQLKRDIDKLKSLQTVPEENRLDSFSYYISQLLTGKWHSLEIHINIKSYGEVWNGPIMTIEKMKTKKMLLCKIRTNETIRQYVAYDFDHELTHIGWLLIKSNNYFQLKHALKTPEDMESFNMIIARTFIEPFSYLIQHASHHYLLTKQPDDKK